MMKIHELRIFPSYESVDECASDGKRWTWKSSLNIFYNEIYQGKEWVEPLWESSGIPKTQTSSVQWTEHIRHLHNLGFEYKSNHPNPINNLVVIAEELSDRI